MIFKNNITIYNVRIKVQFRFNCKLSYGASLLPQAIRNAEFFPGDGEVIRDVRKIISLVYNLFLMWRSRFKILNPSFTGFDKIQPIG